MLNDIERSGLTKEDAKKLKLKQVSKQAMKSLVGASADGYVIPYFTPQGKPTEYFRTRLFNYKGRNSKPQKYSQPSGSGAKLYFPPLVDWDYISTEPNVPLYITEGEKKAAKACKEGAPTIGLGGVWSIKCKKKNQPLIEDFKLVQWSGRRVTILYDSDLLVNDDVTRAMSYLAEALSGLGADVYMGCFPQRGVDKVGMDDYLLEHSVVEMAALPVEPFFKGQLLHTMNTEVAFIENPGAIYQFKTRLMFKKDDIVSMVYATNNYTETTDEGKSRVVNVAGEWIKWPRRRTHSHLTYAPGQSAVLPDSALNTWGGWGVEPEKGSIELWSQLLDFIFGSQVEFRQWFEMWLAYPMQNPGVKMTQSVLLWSLAHGTGKSFIGYIVGRIYGSNFSEVNQDDIQDGYNDWMVNKQFIMGEEITGTDKRRDADKLKSMISREDYWVSIKYRPKYKLPDCANYYFTSNHPDALYVETSDRRTAVHEVEGSPLPEAFFKQLDAWYRGSGPAHLFHYLLNDVDCASFNPKGPAFSSGSKSDMVELSRSDLDTFAHNIKETPETILAFDGMPIDRDLFTVEQLVALYGKDTTKVALSKALRRAGFKQLPVTTTDDGSLRLWALRNAAHWHQAPHHARAKHYATPGTKPVKVLKFAPRS